MEIGEKQSTDFHVERLWSLAESTVNDMRKTVDEIRKMIPRYGRDS
jgi:hypothetical protein